MKGVGVWCGASLLAAGLPASLDAQRPPVATVSAASFAAGAPIAPDSIASAFGQGLATATAAAETLPLPTRLGGTTLSITDSRGVERAAALFFVSTGQVNFLVPGETAVGAATVTVRGGDGSVSTGSVEIRAAAPALFAANSGGRGVPAALALRVAADGTRTTTAVARFDAERRSFVSEGVDLGVPTDQVYLLLFGTGIRGATRGVTVTVGGETVPVLAAVPQGQFAGLDQVNAGPLPRTLMGRGDVETVVTADGVRANIVTLRILSPPPAGEWGTRARLIEANSEMAVAELDGKVYVIGGYPSNRVSVSTVQVYDPATDSWRLTTPLPMTINHLMAAGVNGKLYVIGGQVSNAGNGPFLNNVFEYDPVAATWTARAPMPTARSSGAVAVVGGKIYVAGGRPPRGSDFAVYDPRANAWQTLPNLPTQRNHLAAAAIGGKVYVVGGRFEGGANSPRSDALEVFDPATGAWTSRARMLRPRGGVNGLEAAGCLHVFGGEGNNELPSGVFPDHDVYNPLADTWTRLAPLPTPVHGVTGAAFLDGLIHLPGGGTEIGGSSGSTIHQVYRPAISCR